MRTTKAILDELVTRLTALQWTPAYEEPAEPAPEAAFQVVKRYDLVDIEAAFRELLVNRQRVGLVIYLGTRFPPAGEGAGQVARGRVVSVALLLSDRVHGKRQDAAFGDAAGTATPGALGLLDLAVAALPGTLFAGAEAVDCAPTEASLLDIEDLEKAHPARVAVQLTLECSDRLAGVMPDQTGDDDP